MTAMQDTYWMGGRVCRVEEGEVPPDGAIELAIFSYGNQVVDNIDTHLFPMRLQVVEEGDGDYLWWFAEAFDVDDPDARVLKRAVMRDYIRRAYSIEYAV